jgi:manganese transport protein
MRVLTHIGQQASKLASIELFKYIGPGFFVTVGFIDPGNWVTNVAAGSQFGYGLLWVVTLSTIILIIIQHNAAHLGIVTGLCLNFFQTLAKVPDAGQRYGRLCFNSPG